MAFSLFNTLPSSTGFSAANAYMLDTFLPTVGWTTGAHPDATGSKRVANRSYTNQYTGNTLTNYFWLDWSVSPGVYWYEDSTYTTVPGDLGTNNNSILDLQTNAASYSANDWKFWTSSVRSSASLVTRGKYVLFCDFGVTDVFAYEDPAWTGASDTKATCFYPYNHNLNGALRYCNAPVYAGTSTVEGYLIPNHEGNSIGTQPGVDSIIKGWDMSYGGAGAATRSHGIAYRVTGDEIVLHVPGGGAADNTALTSTGVVVQNGSDYYFRLSSNMAGIAPMLNMGTSEPDFS